MNHYFRTHLNLALSSWSYLTRLMHLNSFSSALIRTCSSWLPFLFLQKLVFFFKTNTINHVLLAVAQSRSLLGAQDESPDVSCDESPDESLDETPVSDMLSYMMNHRMSHMMSHLMSHMNTPANQLANHTRRMLKCFDRKREKRKRKENVQLKRSYAHWGGRFYIPSAMYFL